MTVMENLEMGAYLSSDRSETRRDLEKVFSLFPVLRERAGQSGGTLSGGEQQMLAIARALMARPKMLMLDEPSMGLAPLIVRKIFEVIRRINDEGIPILLVEQNAQQALAIAHRGYVLQTGRIELEGRAKDLLQNPDVRKAYLGID
jgi:branched-chain amino acid transport system ATP-binding protein